MRKKGKAIVVPVITSLAMMSGVIPANSVIAAENALTVTGTSTVKDVDGDFDDYEITAKVTVDGDKITNIEVTPDAASYNEDNDPYWDWAVDGRTRKGVNYPGVINQILEKQSVDGIDTISGATCTSEAVIAAVKNALEQIPAKDESVYVLMNVPYAAFYAAENASIGDVDAVSSATNKTGNYGKAGGAFHSGQTAEIDSEGKVTAVGGANGSQVKGVTWAVKASDISEIEALGGTLITDDSTVTTATLGKGQASSNLLRGYQALTEAPAYSYYVLSEAPDNYLELKDGKFTAGSSAVITENKIDVDVSYGTNWGDVQLDLGDASSTSDKIINAMIITADDGTVKGFYHLDQIWAYSEVGWKVAVTDALDGKTIKNIRYYCSVKDTALGDTEVPAYSNYVYDYPVDIPISSVYTGEVSAEFENNSTISVSGYPADAKNVKAKVYHTTGGRNAVITYLTPLEVDPVDDDIDPVSVDVKDGKIEINPGSVTNNAGTTKEFGKPIDGIEYTIELSSDNYIINKVKAVYSEKYGGFVLMNIPYAEFYKSELDSVNVDAVTSATASKWKTQAGSYYDEAASQITGVIYPVKAEKEDLEGLTKVWNRDELKSAPAHSYFVLEENPDFYKELSLGSGSVEFTKSSAELKTDSVEAKLATSSNYGDYQLNVTGKFGTVYGVVVNTKEGGHYILRHLENIWKSGTQLSWSVGIKTKESHGNDLVYEVYKDMPGQTITSLTYYTDSGVTEYSTGDIYIPIKLADMSVEVSDADVKDETTDITLANIPDDFDIEYVLDGNTVSVEGNKLTCAGLTIGSHTLTLNDKSGKYAPISATFKVSTEDMPATVNDDITALIPAEGFTQENFDAYIKNISSVTVDGTSYNASGKRSVKVVNTDGTLIADSSALKDKVNAEVVVKATGYPDLAFTYNPYSGYVLMNIPYSVFYDAESAVITDVDAISSATNKTGNYGKAGGAYHSGQTAEVDSEGNVTAVGGVNGSQVKGTTWAVKADDISEIEALGGTLITDESAVTTATLGKGQSSYNNLKGYQALTEAPAYSYYLLKEVPDNYLELKDGKIVVGSNSVVKKDSIDVDVSYGTNWGDVQLDIAGIDDISDKIVNAVVITAEDGTTRGLYHLDQVWANNSIGWKVSVTDGLDGKKITNIRYYCSTKDSDLKDTEVPAYANYVYDYPTDFEISSVYTGEVAATFEDDNTIAVTGLPKDAENIKAKVYHTTGGRNAVLTYLTPLEVDPADDDIDPVNVDVVNGKISFSSGSVTNAKGDTKEFGNPIDGTEYVIELSSDNYIINKVKAVYTKTEPEEIHVTSVKLDKTSATLTEGGTLSLNATVSPEDADDKLVTWTSSDASVASVDANGKVTAKKAGTATITVKTKDGNKTATCKVTVKAKVINVTSVKLNKTAATVTEGDSLALTATVAPSNATDKSVTWTSSDASVASVDANGKVTAKKAGTATITVKTKDGNKTATCKVTVKAKVINVTSVKLNKTTATVTEGDSLALTATVAPSNATDKSVTWTSSDASVASVDANGKVTAKKAGTATITVKTKDGNKTATCKVTVKAKVINVTSVKLNKTTATVTEGDSLALTATVAPSNATDKSVTWTSSDASVASVDANGKVTAKKAGTATITVKTKDGNKTATCKVTVKAKVINVTSVKLNKTTATLEKGKTLQLTATVAPSNATDKSVTWTSSDSKVASVDASGKVTAVAKGTATITVKTKDGGKTATCKVTVNEPASNIKPSVDTTNKGWVKENGKFKYYGTDGKPYTGWKYLTSKDGEKIPHWSFFGSDGVLRTGWQYLTSKDGEKTPHWSYFGDNGWLRTGWQYLTEKDGEKTPHWSYFGDNGWLRTGWQYLTEKDGEKTPHWSFFGSNGWLRTGWQYLTSKDGEKTPHWSYFGPNGWLRTGWQTMGTAANPDGKSKVHRSYFGGNGWLRTGNVNINGKVYSFDSRGWLK